MIKVGAVAVVTSAIVSVKKGSIRFRAVVSDTTRHRRIPVVSVVAALTVIVAVSAMIAVAASAETIAAVSVAARVAAVAVASAAALAVEAAVAVCLRRLWAPVRAS